MQAPSTTRVAVQARRRPRWRRRRCRRRRPRHGTGTVRGERVGQGGDPHGLVGAVEHGADRAAALAELGGRRPHGCRGSPGPTGRSSDVRKASSNRQVTSPSTISVVRCRPPPPLGLPPAPGAGAPAGCPRTPAHQCHSTNRTIETPRPTTTMQTRRTSARQAPAVVAAELAADDRAGGDEGGHRPVDVGDQDEDHRGHAVDHEGQHVLGAVEALEAVVDEDGQQADEDHPLGGTEVPAVDAGEEDPDQQGAPTVDVALAPCGQPRADTGAGRPSARRPAAPAPGTAALNTLRGRARRRTAPVSPPAREPRPRVSSRDRWPSSSRR